MFEQQFPRVVEQAGEIFHPSGLPERSRDPIAQARHQQAVQPEPVPVYIHLQVVEAIHHSEGTSHAVNLTRAQAKRRFGQPSLR